MTGEMITNLSEGYHWHIDEGYLGNQSSECSQEDNCHQQRNGWWSLYFYTVEHCFSLHWPWQRSVFYGEPWKSPYHHLLAWNYPMGSSQWYQHAFLAAESAPWAVRGQYHSPQRFQSLNSFFWTCGTRYEQGWHVFPVNTSWQTRLTNVDSLPNRKIILVNVHFL